MSGIKPWHSPMILEWKTRPRSSDKSGRMGTDPHARFVEAPGAAFSEAKWSGPDRYT